eukprot:6051403-Prymnesium_polylepis.1
MWRPLRWHPAESSPNRTLRTFLHSLRSSARSRTVHSPRNSGWVGTCRLRIDYSLIGPTEAAPGRWGTADTSTGPRVVGAGHEGTCTVLTHQCRTRDHAGKSNTCSRRRLSIGLRSSQGCTV